MTKPATTHASKTASKICKAPKAARSSHLETLEAILDGKLSLADVHRAANDTTAAGTPAGRRRPVNPTDAIEGPIPPRSNVLPKTATGDEVDVHWIFNWADGELEPAPFTSPYEQQLLKTRVQLSPALKTQEPNDQERAAARRSSRIRTILLRLRPEQVSVLARWSAPPAKIPEPIFACFGRLSAVTGVTAGYREIGGGAALIESCERVTERRPKKGKKAGGQAANAPHDFLRELAQTKLTVIRGQAERLLEEAFAAYAAARAVVDAEEASYAAHKRRLRNPALAEIERLLGLAPSKPAA